MFNNFVVLLGLCAALTQAVEFPAAKKQAAGWSLDTQASLKHDSLLTMRIALAPQNANELTEKVHSMANPKSGNFRKYLTNEQISSLVGVRDEDMEKVYSWLKESGFNVVEVPPNRDWVTVEAKVSAIEKGLNTKLAIWSHKATGQVGIF